MCLRIPWHGGGTRGTAGCGVDAVHLGAQRQDVKERIEQRVADFLQQIRGTCVAHEGRAGMAPNDCARKRCRNVGGTTAGFSQIHAFVEAAEHDERRLVVHQLTDGFVVGLFAWLAGHREVAGQPHLVFEEVTQAARIGFIGHHREAGGAEEVLCD